VNILYHDNIYVQCIIGKGKPNPNPNPNPGGPEVKREEKEKGY
jgi:hypothetical protein